MNISQIDQSTHGNHSFNETKVTHFTGHDLVKYGTSRISRLKIDIGTRF